MTQEDLDNGQLIVTVAVAPLRPAEFVVISIAQAVRARDGSPNPP